LIGLGSQLGAEFLPELDEGSIFFRANFPAGISLRENAENAPKIREIISKYGAVSYVISQTGRNDDGTDPFPSNRNEILIGLKDYALWTDTLSKKALITQLQAELETAFPSVRFSAGQPIIDQVMEIVTGSAADLAVSIVGQDLELMRAKADTIALIMNQIEGSQAVNIEQEGPQDQLVFEIDRLAAARYGINVAEIQHLIEAAVGGKPITQIYEGVRNYEVILRYQAQYRQNLDQLQDLLVSSSNGALLPLRELCRIAYKPGQTNIYRYNNKRMVTVRTNIRGRDQGSFVRELQTKIKQTLTLPKGYELVYGGQYENLERAGVQLKLSIPLTIALVFILLFMLYGNLWHSLLTMTCILFALAGGIAALLWRGLYFNVSAGVGFVSIFGISVMAGVVLVSALNRAARNDLAPKYWIAATATSQLRAILSIMSLAILGLIPAAISTGIGSDVQRPLATVIIGGLTATLIFAPLLLPPLYALGYGSSPQGNSNTKIAP
jgi:cobalt-zinc-cadmium resistance protein CzcA